MLQATVTRALATITGADEANLREAVRVMEEECGSVLGFMRHELGFTDAMGQALRAEERRRGEGAEEGTTTMTSSAAPVADPNGEAEEGGGAGDREDCIVVVVWLGLGVHMHCNTH